MALYGGQRELGIPEPHEPGHIRECRNEVRRIFAFDQGSVLESAEETPERATFLRGEALQGGWGFPRVLSGRGWGLSARGPRRSRGQSAVFCTIVAVLREEWDSVLARWTARVRHPGAT